MLLVFNAFALLLNVSSCRMVLLFVRLLLETSKYIRLFAIFSFFFFLQEIAYTTDEVGKRVTAWERRWGVI
jgi:hypothetical protein